MSHPSTFSPGPAVARIRSFAFIGIDAIPVTVEVQITSGLPAFLIVGLADKAVGESRERVRAALAAIGLALPPKRILVNLTPADLPKEGAHLDLPIAIALLVAMGVIPHETAYAYAALGELSLDGQVNRVTGVLAAALGAVESELGLICPASQSREARWANTSLDILAPQDLMALISHFRGEQILCAVPDNAPPDRPQLPDMADIRGMIRGRRALEIAAAGAHSLLLCGAPGAGKSMLASRLPSILPDLTSAQVLETTRIHSVSGHLETTGLVIRPPFREPHHSASLPALVGGGSQARPGEVSLAHNGVLFLDELPEFSRQCIESLRQPIETGSIMIARATRHITYPARFQLVAAMNPCRCGYLGDAERSCRKAPRCGEDYTAKISGPMLDRIDIRLDVQPVSPIDISRGPAGEPSDVIRGRVTAARDRQIRRQNSPNAQADTRQFALSQGARDLAEQASERLKLSGRGMTRLMRVAMTIADLEGVGEIARPHMAEALGLRQK